MRAAVFILKCVVVFIVTLASYLVFRSFDGGPIWSAPARTETPPEKRERLLKENGGTKESENAVARGLSWLAKQQKDDGHWEFDGSSKDHVAATGMALLPFLGAGQTPDADAKYAKEVKAGLDWLTARVDKESGSLGTNNMYAHAIGTIALCDAVGLTKDDKVKAKAELAVAYIVRAQGRNGSWGYTGPAPSEGDTSIVGWQIQALTAARIAGIKFEKKDKVYKDANKFLESVSTDSGSKYGYREKGASQTLTPVGLLSRYYLGEMSPRHPALGRGVEFLKQFPPKKEYFDMYYYYYATRVVHFYEGPDWHKLWNPKMRDLLIDLQVKREGDKLGSWDKDQGFIGSSCGRLGTTSLAVLTLEVYYRDTPLYKRDSGGLQDLDK